MLLQTSPQLVMFAQNICLLIFLLIIAVVAIFVFIAAWTGANIFAWRSSQKKAQLDELRGKTDRFGNPLPPAGRGICEACQCVADDVLHLPDGRRLCQACYEIG